jgi:hypothetical protein
MKQLVILCFLFVVSGCSGTADREADTSTTATDSGVVFHPISAPGNPPICGYRLDAGLEAGWIFAPCPTDAGADGT